jgi:hypothetical protein
MIKKSGSALAAVWLLASLAGAAQAASWYVSPTGTPTGDGSINRPWDLTTAFNSKDHSLGGPIQPGDVVYLRGGRYASPGPYVWWPTLTGAAATATTPRNPIVFRSYPGDPRPALDLLSYYDALIFDNPLRAANTMKYTVHDVDFYDIEIYSSTIVRSSSASGNNGQPNALMIEGENIKMIHCYVHDLGDLASFSPAKNNQIYGTITMDHGWLAPDRGHGHLMYIENDNSNGSVKVMENNFGFTSYDAGVQEYGTAALTRAITFNKNTLANAGGARAVNSATIQWMIGQNDPTQIVADSNVFYVSPDLGSGYVEGGWQWDYQNGTLQFTNNWVIGPDFQIGNWNTATVTGNHVFPRNANVSFYLYADGTGQAFSNWTTNNNVYGPATFVSGTRDATTTSASARAVPGPWQTAISGDYNSTFNAAPSTAVLINPSTYIPGRVHITVWNPSGNSSVAVNLASAGLTDGAQFVVYDAQNFGGSPVLTGTYSAGSPTVTFPAANLVRKAMIGVGAQPEHTAPYLLTFVLMSGQALTGAWTPSGGALPPPPPPPAGPPTVAVTAPNAGSTLSGTTTVSATASSGNGIAKVQFLLDGSNLGSAATSAPYQVSWNTTSSANGIHQLAAVAYDTLGNFTSSGTVSVTVSNIVDTIPPTISISSPINGQTVSNTVSVSSSASDNVGVVSVQYLLDGTAVSTTTSAPYSYSWNTTTASNGAHTLTAMASDAAGNKGTASVSITVQNIASALPTAAAYWPLDSATTSGNLSIDQSGHGNNLTMNSVVSVAGAVNQGLQFNGSSSSMPASNTSALNLSSSMTLSGWVKTTSTRAESLISKYYTGGTEAGYLLKTTAQGTVAFRIGGSNSSAGAKEVTDTKKINDGNWHHVAVVVILGQSATFYIDGTQTSSFQFPSAAGTSPSPFQLGNIDYVYYAYPFTGALDEVNVFNAALSASQVASLIGATRPVVTPPSGPPPDTTPPTVSISSPTQSQTVSGTITVTASASDNVGVAGVKFQLDGVALGVEQTTAPYSVSWNTTTATNASHTLTAIARDAAGNTASASVSVAVNNVVTPPPPATGPAPTAYWSFDASAINPAGAVDLAPNPAGLTIQNATSGPGKVNQALVFNGATSVLSTYASKLELNTSMTLAAWIKTTNSTRAEAILSKYDAGGTEKGYLLRTGPTGKLTLQIGGGNLTQGAKMVTDTAVVNDGAWHHAAVVIQMGQSVTFYVDGVQTSAQPLVTVPGSADAPFEVGQVPYSGYGLPFTGSIDEVKVFNSALTAAQVAPLASGN